MANGIQKGKQAERDVVKILQDCVDTAYRGIDPDDVPRIQRSGYTQSDGGGSDIMGLPWLACEVKFHKKAQPAVWWKQAEGQARKGQTPVLIYKANFKGWRVRMRGGCGEDDVWSACIVDIELQDFRNWFISRLIAEIEKR